MELKINVEKRHIYFFGLLIALAGGILFVQGSGSNTFGHGARDLYVTIEGSEKSLQEAVDNGEIGGKFAKARHDIDDNVEEYTVNLERYHITATAPNYGGTNKEIDHGILTDLCGDFDGCEVRIGMTRWTQEYQREAANRGPYILYYAPSNGRWRLWDNSGTDQDGTGQHVLNIWSTCYFTDGEFDNYAVRGDSDKGFSLLVWNNYRGPTRTCELTLID